MIVETEIKNIQNAPDDDDDDTNTNGKNGTTGTSTSLVQVDSFYTYYKGEVQKDTTIKHGFGTLEYKSSPDGPLKLIYIGEWQNGSKHGQGLQTWSSGATYQGGWIDNKRHGRGAYTYVDGNTYEGDWVEGLKQGRGTFVWSSSGSRYEGEWVGDLRHGQGLFVYANGRRYDGGWKKNKKHGKGIVTNEDGSSYVGYYMNGKRVPQQDQQSPKQHDEKEGQKLSLDSGTNGSSLHAKKILLAFDGSGNNARDFAPNKDKDRNFTNVLRLHLLAGGSINGDRNDIEGQISLYERGIGGKTNSNCLRTLRFMCGDLNKQIKPMKKRLEEVYEPGDKLYIIGFSRGSSSAREFAMDLYEGGLRTKNGEKVEEPPIEFLGCFDTVSMQIKKRLFDILRIKRKREITPSTVLKEEDRVAPNVKKAVHNVALDDNREWKPFKCFPPVLMGAEERIHEVWFPGVHGDVGGSYYNSGLSDISCMYMEEWMESLGLKFKEEKDINEESLKIRGHEDIKINLEDLIFKPNATGKMHHSEKKGQVKTDGFTPSYRPVHVVKNNRKVHGEAVYIHESVLLRMEAMKNETQYHVNPNLKDTNFKVVGSLGEVSDDKTQRLKALL